MLDFKGHSAIKNGYYRSIMGNLEVWYRDYLDFTPRASPTGPMVRSAQKRAVDRLLEQAKVD
jgi:hypothetical protein